MILAFVLLTSFPVEGQYSTSPPISTVGLAGTRDVTLNIRVVMLGLSSSDVNSTYLTAKINVPSIKPQAILAGAQNTGVTYRFNYNVSFANSTVVSSFVSFLNGIVITKSAPPGPSSPNPYFDNSTTEISTVVNSYYNASAVEDWFNSSLAFGPAPVPGYTLFIADLHNYLPSYTYQQYQNYTSRCVLPCTQTATVHYYNRTVTDTDLGLMGTRHFMTGWGGNNRFYYADLSAGPSYWTAQLPIQVASELLRINSISEYARYWRTQFISDYIAGAVYNLFAPDPVYPVNYSDKYNFHLFVFDGRSANETAAVPIRTTVNETVVLDEMKKLIPYSNVTLRTQYANVTDYPGLEGILQLSNTSITDPAIGRPVVDAWPVYNWLSTSGEGHVTQFINATQTIQEFDITAFIFAFTTNYTFAITFKEHVALKSNLNSFAGIAVGDLVLIGQGQYDFTIGNNLPFPLLPQPGKGIGFTLTIIHELGHMVGLPHPFNYDLTEDFVDSVMGYYPSSLQFSQFDKDTLLRGVNDQLLIFAEVTLANTTSSLFNGGQISAAKQAIAVANQKYGAMQYAEAVQDSYNAALNAFAAHQLATSGLFAIFSPGLVFGLIGLAVGAAVGVLVGYLVFKRKPTSGIQYYRCPTCQQPLRWDAVMTRWYCDRCQKPI